MATGAMATLQLVTRREIRLATVALALVTTRRLARPRTIVSPACSCAAAASSRVSATVSAAAGSIRTEFICLLRIQSVRQQVGKWVSVSHEIAPKLLAKFDQVPDFGLARH